PACTLRPAGSRTPCGRSGGRRTRTGSSTCEARWAARTWPVGTSSAARGGSPRPASSSSGRGRSSRRPVTRRTWYARSTSSPGSSASRETRTGPGSCSSALTGESDAPILAWDHRELGLALGEDNPRAAEKHLRLSIELYERAEQAVDIAVTYRALGDLLRSRDDEAAACEAYRTGILALEPHL